MPEMPRPTRLNLVIATWCPHCVPLSTKAAPRLADALHVPLRVLDVDEPPEERIADRLVLDHGDWSADYLVPQVFLEWSDGHVEHLLTGTPGSTEGTQRSWDRLLSRGIPSTPG
jgi:hypothetical protein